MTTYTRGVSIALAVAVLAACGAEQSASTRSDAVLSDARSGGAAGFYFLPPIAPDPGDGTVNDPGLSPVVEIAPVGASAAVIARFEGADVKASGSHYMALWSTKEFVPAPGTAYRIRVLLGGKALGFADAQVATDGKELRLLASSEIFGLTGERTVPIKFRIHVPEDLCRGVTCTAPTQCQASACDAATGACVVTALAAGIACNDGNPCTVGDACDGAGACVPGAPAACAGADACNASACDPTTGSCTTHPVATGTICTTSGGYTGYCIGPPAGPSACIRIL